MRWPWQRREVREAQPFTDAVVAAIQSTATGEQTGNPAAIAALEFCASAYANAFAAARIEPDIPSLTPAVRSLIGRNLIRRGEDLHLIEVGGGAIRLRPVGSWDVRGTDDPEEWFVRADLFGPSGNRTVFRPHSAFLHTRYAVDPARPWYGIPPLGWARSTGTLAGALETRLAQEAGGPSGYVLPVPQDGGDSSDSDPLADFKRDMARAAGKTMLAETVSQGWGEGKGGGTGAGTTSRSGSARTRRTCSERCEAMQRNPSWPPAACRFRWRRTRTEQASENHGVGSLWALWSRLRRSWLPR